MKMTTGTMHNFKSTRSGRSFERNDGAIHVLVVAPKGGGSGKSVAPNPYTGEARNMVGKELLTKQEAKASVSLLSARGHLPERRPTRALPRRLARNQSRLGSLGQQWILKIVESGYMVALRAIEAVVVISMMDARRSFGMKGTADPTASSDSTIDSVTRLLRMFHDGASRKLQRKTTFATARHSVKLTLVCVQLQGC
ncbi:hypothetical protein PsorP6_006512 [Peronosclerospora sorghi]|uniref:Uncharacterized protein n=1 Tax=Peronosclerospora sorghi TaxID=230839 RepID=A0ACC0W3E3_9STRA|nr:hypothetical protein PsorP6_006512 [Peronosclerospora sorghi]